MPTMIVWVLFICMTAPNASVITSILRAQDENVTDVSCHRQWHVLQPCFCLNLSLAPPLSHTSQAHAVSPPCPACSAPSGPLRASPTRATSTRSARRPSPPTPSPPTPPSAGSLEAAAHPSSTPALTPSAPTWTWTSGTPHPAAAPTPSCPMTRAIAATSEKWGKRTMMLNLWWRQRQQTNVLLSIMGKMWIFSFSVFLLTFFLKHSMSWEGKHMLYIFLDVLQFGSKNKKKKVLYLMLLPLIWFIFSLPIILP